MIIKLEIAELKKLNQMCIQMFSNKIQLKTKNKKKIIKLIKIYKDNQINSGILLKKMKIIETNY